MIFSTILLEAGAVPGPQAGGFSSLIPMVVIMVGLFYFMNRSNKKKEKEAQLLRESTEVGDEISSIGGIVGRVVKVEENTLLIESGAANTKLRIVKEAVGTNNTAIDRAEERKASMAKEKAEAKEKKAEAKGKKD